MKRRPLLERSGAQVFREAKQWSELVHGLGDVRLEKQLIQIAAVGSSTPLPDLLRATLLRRDSGLNEIDTKGGLPLFRYRRAVGGGRQRLVVEGEFVVAQPSAGAISALVFVEPASFYHRCVAPLIRGLYPTAARPYLTQRELHDLLKSLQSAVRPSLLRVREFSAKRRLGVQARKRFESVRDWTDVNLSAAFQDAQERNVWFSAVSFDIVAESAKRTVPAGPRGRLTKYGYLAVNGDFQIFEGTVVRELVKFAADRLDFFSNRSRSSTLGHAPRPVKLEYQSAPFRSPENAGRLVEALRRFRHGNCTVLHGNPYVHVAIVDSIDYSCADLWVLSHSEIIVVPQVAASEAALRRIVNHVFEYFGEGMVSDYHQQ